MFRQLCSLIEWRSCLCDCRWHSVLRLVLLLRPPAATLLDCWSYRNALAEETSLAEVSEAGMACNKAGCLIKHAIMYLSGPWHAHSDVAAACVICCRPLLHVRTAQVSKTPHASCHAQCTERITVKRQRVMQAASAWRQVTASR
jgi:hypothetical protein